MTKKNIIITFLIYLFLCLIFIISVFPFIWIIICMTNSSVDVIGGRLLFGNQLLKNFEKLFSSYDLPNILLNSIKVSGFSVIGTLIISSMAAYGFELYSSFAKDTVYKILMLSMMVPFSALMIPLFRLYVFFLNMHLVDSHTILILTSISSIFMIFFFRQSFKLFPREIIHAARVDGASDLKTFFLIVIPAVKHTYAAAAIYAFITSWNAYLWPLIVIQSDKQKTITLFISSMTSAYYPEYGVVMSAIVVATLPTIILFFSLQKYFVQGLIGSIKQ